MISLATVTAKTFEALVNTPLKVRLPTGEMVEGTLAEVVERPSGVGVPGAEAGRAPFSFYLHLAAVGSGPPQQGMLAIEHASLGGAIEVFAVPTGRKGSLVVWEIIFN